MSVLFGVIAMSFKNKSVIGTYIYVPFCIQKQYCLLQKLQTSLKVNLVSDSAYQLRPEEATDLL